MRYLVFLLISCFVRLLHAQNAVDQVIPGTKISMVPPDSFVLAQKFSGFQHNESGSSIMVSELPAPFQVMTNAFTKEALQAKGMELLGKEQITLGVNAGLIFFVRQTANNLVYLKQILVFGDSTHTTMINGIYPEKYKETLEGKIKASLRTAHPSGSFISPEQAAPFEIDVKETPFSFGNGISGSLYYVAQDDVQVEGKKSSVIIVGSAIGEVAIGDKKQFVLDRLMKMPNGENLKPDSIQQVRIAGMDGYEITAHQENSQNEAFYQLILFDDAGSYYIFVGMAMYNQAQFLVLFKKIARTFHLKK
ncbi:MAG: hypothetical protein ACOYPR_15570 [Saprospiraceae bacterium]|jgi:hypothetical protein